MRLILPAMLLVVCLPTTATPQTEAGSRVDLTAKQAPLRAVLQSIDAQSGIHIIFSDDLVKGHMVSFDGRNVIADQVLRSILRNTGLTFQSQEGQYIIIRQTDSPRQTISGRVIDGVRGEVLPYATVSISGRTHRTQTNRAGYFTLVNVPAPPCTLQIQYIGYQTRVIPVKHAESTDTIQIELNPSPLSFDGMTVQAGDEDYVNIDETTGSFSIDGGLFDMLPGLFRSDIARSLQLMPGITMGDARVSGVSIRGSSPNENLFLLDGMTLFQANHGFGLFSALDADVMKNVRVYKGNFPARFGGRLAGVVDFTTRSGDFHKPHAKFSVDPTSMRGTLELPFAGKGALLITGRRSYTGYRLRGQHDRVTRVHSGAFSMDPADQHDLSFVDLLGKITLMPSQKDLVTVSTYFGENKANVVDRHQEFGSNERFINNSWGNYGVSGRWHRQWYPRIESRVTIGFSHYEVNYKDESNVISTATVTGDSLFRNYDDDFTNSIDEFIIDVNNRWQAPARHTVEFGGILSRTRKKIDHTDYFTQAFPGRDLRSENELHQRNNGFISSLYLQDNWRPTRLFNTTVGLRLNDSPIPNTIHWEPRVSMRIKPWSSISFKASWGLQHQYLVPTSNGTQNISNGLNYWHLASGSQTLDIRTLSNSNGETRESIVINQPNVRPGRAVYRSIGLQMKHGNILMDIEGYHKRLDYVLNLSRSESFGNLRSYDGYARGIDIMLKRGNRKSSQRISYSIGQARMRRTTLVDIVAAPSFPELNEPAGLTVLYPMDRDRPHSLKLVNLFSHQGWTFSTTWQYAAGTPYTPRFRSVRDDGRAIFLPGTLNSARLPSLHHLDIGVVRTLSQGAWQGKIGLAIHNLYNRKNVWHRRLTSQSDITGTDTRLLSTDVTLPGITPTVFVQVGF